MITGGASAFVLAVYRTDVYFINYFSYYTNRMVLCYHLFPGRRNQQELIGCVLLENRGNGLLCSHALKLTNTHLINKRGYPFETASLCVLCVFLIFEISLWWSFQY